MSERSGRHLTGLCGNCREEFPNPYSSPYCPDCREPTVMTDGGELSYRCMFCNETHPGRGMKQHVRWTADDGHGPRGEVPDDYELEDCERVGSES